MEKYATIIQLESLVDAVKTDCTNRLPVLYNGLMGIALLYYFVYKKSGKKCYLDFADRLLERATDNLSGNLSSSFEQGLSGVGWSIEYLVGQGFVSGDTDLVLADFDILFREKLMVGNSKIDEIVGMGLYFSERIRRKRSKSSDMRVKRLMRNILLCLNKLDSNWNEISASDGWLMPCFFMLIDFYQLNVCRFKVIQLIERILMILYQSKGRMTGFKQMYTVMLLDRLASCGCMYESFSEKAKKNIFSFREEFEHEGRGEEIDSFPCLMEADGQLFLITGSQHCVSLLSSLTE